MKAAGKREKGRRLELKVAQLIRKKGLDSKARRMVLSGGDPMMPGDIYTKLQFSFECKNQEQMSFWTWWEQAEAQKRPMRPTVLVHTANYRPIMISMKFTDWLDILKELEDYKLERT
jgi:organic radical activating enzyme